jgi:1,4-dihydroxy-2-naphthoate octaprenyltransferase
MTLGTHIAIAGAYAPSAFAVAMVPFFQVGNLLLLNQFPDVDADHSVGRRHLPIALGRPRSALVYALFSALAYAALVGAVAARVLPMGALLGLATLPLSAIASLGAVRHADRVERLEGAMRLNVLVSLLTPVLMAVGLMLR